MLGVVIFQGWANFWLVELQSIDIERDLGSVGILNVTRWDALLCTAALSVNHASWLLQVKQIPNSCVGKILNAIPGVLSHN